jgi:voltage-gated potassium channel
LKKLILFVANRLWLILLIYVASLTISAALFSHFEGKSFVDGLWWSAVTALTIGYGDLSPASLAGRITGVVFGHIVILGIVPLIIGNVISRLLEDKNKFTHQEQEWQEAALKKIAQKVGVQLDDAPADF